MQHENDGAHMLAWLESFRFENKVLLWQICCLHAILVIVLSILGLRP